MQKSSVLNVLGCWPERMNILFELAYDTKGINSFNVLKNMAVEIDEYYNSNNKWDVNVYNCYEIKNTFNPDEYYAFLVNGTKSKEIVFNYFKELIKMENEQFINLIHPSSVVSKSVNLNYGMQVEPLCSISTLTSFGFGVIIKSRCNIDHHCNIGNFVTINPGVVVSGFVDIGKNTLIGSGTVIKDNIKIGENTIIGSGSNVVRDIPDNVVAYGNPCRVHRIND